MKNYYLLVNPKGGHKRGLEIYEKVKHVFSSAGTNITVLHTEYAGHAYDFAKTLDFVGYDGLCAIGGDGTMYELINGMLKRDDNYKIPIGLITGGTGNSFMYDVDCLDPLDAAKRIVQHKLRPLDIAKVNANGTEGPPPPPPPPQDEMSNKQTRNFIDFILLLYKKRGSKPSFLLKFLKKC